MKVLYVEWPGLCGTDVKSALKNLGHEVKTIASPLKDRFELNEEYSEAVQEAIGIYCPDMVFSINFFPSVSTACNDTNTIYISWIYDNPHTSVYHTSAKNLCNYIFSFDSHMVKQLQSRGVEHIYYAPLACNVNRVNNIAINKADYEKFKGDVEFMGSMYNEGTDYYSIMIARAKNEYFTGYLEGLLNSQKLVYGYNFMEEALSPEVVNQFREVAEELLPTDSMITEREVYADVFLSPKLATINRVELLYMLGRYFDVHFYTYNKSIIPNIKHCGTVSYEEDMPKLFKIAKINLNDTRRSIKNGIPLRAMDIMGCGGFLLSNYQEDFFRHFEPGVHMELYGSIDEAIDKCDYYLKHDTEREKIKANAYEVMLNEHTYEKRLQEMLEVVKEERGYVYSRCIDAVQGVNE